MKKICVALLLVVTTVPANLKANNPVGEFGIVDLDGSYSDTSFTISSDYIVTVETGDLSDATLTLNMPTVSGLSSGETTPESLSDFLTLTTPTATYELNITSLSVADPGAGFINYTGEGTLTGGGGSSPAKFTIGSTDGDFASVIVGATPEPSTWALLIGSLLSLALFRRRFQRGRPVSPLPQKSSS